MEGERTDPAASIIFYHPRHRLCGAVTPRMPIPSRFPESFILETCTPPLRQRTHRPLDGCMSVPQSDYSLAAGNPGPGSAAPLFPPTGSPRSPLPSLEHFQSPVSGAGLLSDHGGKAYPVSLLFSYRLALQHSLLSATQRVTCPSRDWCHYGNQFQDSTGPLQALGCPDQHSALFSLGILKFVPLSVISFLFFFFFFSFSF